MGFTWLCDGCRSTLRFSGAGGPMDCFAEGVLAGLLLANHRKNCQGSHFEEGGAHAVSLEDALVGAMEGKSWDDLVAEAP
jgi:hypothetical protein